MLRLLVVSLIFCLVGMPGEGWAKNCQQKLGMSQSSPVFSQRVWKYFPWFHVYFVKNERLEWVTGEINVSLGYYSVFYRCHTYKTYQKLRYLEFPPSQLYILSIYCLTYPNPTGFRLRMPKFESCPQSSLQLTSTHITLFVF